MKYFRMSYEEVVFNRSYINVMLLNRSIPSWNTKTNDKTVNKSSQQECQPINKPVHASDFFMDMMK